MVQTKAIAIRAVAFFNMAGISVINEEESFLYHKLGRIVEEKISLQKSF
jgi:hypothetical protein